MDKKGTDSALKSHGHTSHTFDSQRPFSLSIDKAFHLRTIFVDCDGVIWIRRGLILPLNHCIDRRGTDSALKSQGHALHTFDSQRSLSLSIDEAFHLRTIFVDSHGVKWIRRGLILPLNRRGKHRTHTIFRGYVTIERLVDRFGLTAVEARGLSNVRRDPS